MNGNNKKDLKAFVRYDGSGRVVAGSLILRRKKPKVGKWTEIQGYQCCNLPTLTSSSMPSFPVTAAQLVIYCDCGDGYINMGITGTANTIEELVSLLNVQAGAIGKFGISTDGLNVTVNPSATLVPTLSPCSTCLFLEIY